MASLFQHLLHGSIIDLVEGGLGRGRRIAGVAARGVGLTNAAVNVTGGKSAVFAAPATLIVVSAAAQDLIAGVVGAVAGDGIVRNVDGRSSLERRYRSSFAQKEP